MTIFEKIKSAKADSQLTCEFVWNGYRWECHDGDRGAALAVGFGKTPWQALASLVDMLFGPPPWRCYDCGNTHGFTDRKSWTSCGYEYEVICNKCDSDLTAPDGEGEPCCECGNYGWWCEKCGLAKCGECWEWFGVMKEPQDYVCLTCWDGEPT